MEERIKMVLLCTWNSIASDIAEVEAEMGNDTVSKEIVMEMVEDADRLEMYGGDGEAVKVFRTMKDLDRERIMNETFPYSSY